MAGPQEAPKVGKPSVNLAAEFKRRSDISKGNSDHSDTPGFTAFITPGAKYQLQIRSEATGKRLPDSFFVPVDEETVAITMPDTVYTMYGGFSAYEPEGPNWKNEGGGKFLFGLGWHDVYRVDSSSGEKWENWDHTDKQEKLRTWLTENPQFPSPTSPHEA